MKSPTTTEEFRNVLTRGSWGSAPNGLPFDLNNQHRHGGSPAPIERHSESDIP
jgi:hypothetical protein